MQPPPTLLALPEDVLLEILGHFLLDTPPAPLRASLLCTCSTLNELALPLLYRVVDLTGFKDELTVVKHWKLLFGEEGLFAKGGRREKLGEFVRELKLGGARNTVDGIFNDNDSARPLSVPPLRLPNCSSLHVDAQTVTAYLYPHLPNLISQLPIVDLSLRYRWMDCEDSSMPDFSPFPPGLLGLFEQPAAWRDLRRITVDPAVFFLMLETNWDWEHGGDLPFESWSFDVFVLQLFASPSSDDAVLLKPLTLLLTTRPREDDRWIGDVKRIEIELSGGSGGRLEVVWRQEIERKMKVGLNSFKKKIASLIVFVGEDGKERKLMEMVEC